MPCVLPRAYPARGASLARAPFVERKGRLGCSLLLNLRSIARV